MTDQQSPSPEGQANAPVPVPLPIDSRKASGGGRKRWPWVVGVLVLLMLIGGCVAALWVFDDAVTSLTDSVVNGPDYIQPEGGSAGTDGVAWTGDGAYAVIQYHREYQYPSVTVWDRKTGTVRSLDGYRVLFVEQFAPVVWMEPTTDEQVDDANSMDGLGDALDHKPARLVAWKLDDGSSPTDNVSSKWRAWPGPADSVAYLEINPLKGAAPSAVLFNNKASQGEGVKAVLPSSMGTFIPVGWSPSGKYFAIEELVDEKIVVDSPTAKASAADQGVRRNVVVLDVMTGKVSATGTLPSNTRIAPAALWAGTSDRLFWLDLRDTSTEPGSVGIRSMSATGTEGDAFAEFGWTSPSEFDGVYSAAPLGWDPAGPLFAVDGDIWQITASGPKQLGSFGPQMGVWHPAAGMLGVTTEYADPDPDPTEWPEAQVTDIHGGDRKIIWKGPVETLDAK